MKMTHMVYGVLVDVKCETCLFYDGFGGTGLCKISAPKEIGNMG